METEFETFRCSCGSVTHPATGCVFGPRTIVCRNCAETFFRWVQRHTHSRWGGVCFGEHVPFAPRRITVIQVQIPLVTC